MPLVTQDDLRDIYFFLREHGIRFLISRMASPASQRTEARFSEMDVYAPNWWIIPAVQARLNEKISGDPDVSYQEYVIKKYLHDKHGLKMLSPGCGACRQEIVFASANEIFNEVSCIDVSGQLLHRAEKTAAKLGIRNMQFICADARKYDFPSDYFDVIHFHSSLHHFSTLNLFLKKIKKAMKDDGYLILHDYVGPARLQLTKKQKESVNKILGTEMNDTFKLRKGGNSIKKNIAGPGIIRMWLADPSEAVASDQIRSTLLQEFTLVEEKDLGGNILMPLLKDIACNFLENNEETNEMLDRLFQLEDEFLANEPSDFIFGVYSKKQ